VRTSSKDVRASLMLAEGVVAIAVANWSPSSQRVTLDVDWEGLKKLAPIVNPSTARLQAHAIEGFQPHGAWLVSESFDVQGKGSGDNEGWLLRLYSS